MPAQVILSVMRGPLCGREFVFADRTTCLIGRADDCAPQLPNDTDHESISRHHCLLDINPPDVCVRDFGSLNGTFVNGQKIGQRTGDRAAESSLPEVDLVDGDEIALGGTVFRVRIVVPPRCGQCAGEIAEDAIAAEEVSPGVFRCAACRQQYVATEATVDLPRTGPTCSQCGRNVAAEVGPQRQGDFVCANCRAEPDRVVRHLLELAATGDKDLLGLNDYELLRELGHGGMGEVHLARHRRTGALAALKVMLPRIAADASAQKLFLREIEHTRALRHPNVVQVMDAGSAQGTFYFALEYCDGGSVEQLLTANHGPLAVEAAVPIIAQALDGLEYAHNVFGPGHGVVHRDLKPHNLFLSGVGEERVVKVGDFGLSKAFDLAGLSGQTRTGAVRGTPVFMPRQQVVNFKYARPEVDVWAMAATLYYLLTGTSPREFPPGVDWFLIVLQSAAVPIRRRNPTVPRRLAEVIDRALVDQPEILYQQAVTFKNDLLAAL